MDRLQQPHLMVAERRPTFDERLWPILVSLVGLTGLLAVMAAQRLSWDDTRWWHNAAFFVTLIPILGAGVVALVYRFGHRMSDRALALSFVWSLAVNLGLLFAISLFRIHSDQSQPVPQPEVAKASRAEQRPVVPELPVRGSDRPLEAHERPVEAGEPQLTEQPSPDRRWELSQQQENPTEMLASLPLSARQSMGTEVRRMAESAPHRSPLPSQIGRRMTRPDPGIPSPISAPQVTGQHPQGQPLEPDPLPLSRSDLQPSALRAAEPAPRSPRAETSASQQDATPAERLASLPPSARPRRVPLASNPSPVASEPSGGTELPRSSSADRLTPSQVELDRLAQSTSSRGAELPNSLPRAAQTASGPPATDRLVVNSPTPQRQPARPSAQATPAVSLAAEPSLSPAATPVESLNPIDANLERLAAASTPSSPHLAAMAATSPPQTAARPQPAPPISPPPNSSEATRGAAASPRMPAALSVQVPDVSGQSPQSQAQDRQAPLDPASVSMNRTAVASGQLTSSAPAAPSQPPRASQTQPSESGDGSAAQPDVVAAVNPATWGQRQVEGPTVAGTSVQAAEVPGSGSPASAPDVPLEPDRSTVARSGQLGQLAPRAELASSALPAVQVRRPEAPVAQLQTAASDRRSASPRASTVASPPVTLPGVQLDDEDAPSQLDRLLAGAASQGGPDRQQPGSIDVDVDQEAMLSGLADLAAADPGSMRREAQTNSPIVSLDASRFIRRHLASASAVNPPVVAPAEAYRRRMQQRGQPAAGGHGTPPPRTDEAIERGLLFLARHQYRDGHWSLQLHERTVALDDEAPQIASDTAATGLALLCFLGAGYHHRDFDYRDRVRLGLLYLIDGQKETGDLYRPEDPTSNQSAWLYSHAIAALALCEAYGMTQDPNLRPAAQRAIDFIAESQHPVRGGWRYSPRFGSDTSVTGWMLMALKSGELAGLEVPAGVYQRLDTFLDNAQFSRQYPHLFRYNPEAPDTPETRHGRLPTPTMTSVGLLMRLYTGTPLSSSTMQQGAEYLLNRPPTDGSTRQPQRDTYYWYYATQVMFHLGDESWEKWRDHLYPLLIEGQIQEGPLAGSWDPLEPVPDRWAAHAGRLYVTTMNLLSLEVYYRHLPIYANVQPER